MEELSKKERRLQKQIEKEKEKEKNFQQRRIKKIVLLVAVIIVIGGTISGLNWYFGAKPLSLENEILSRKGLHWHPEIKISILGKNQEVPANIGMNPTEKPIHTHATDGVIHLEFIGVVRKNDLKLGNFFEIWGKKFNKDCLFDKCHGSEGELKMLVNGKLNSEFENYIMKDGDKIEIIFR